MRPAGNCFPRSRRRGEAGIHGILLVVVKSGRDNCSPHDGAGHVRDKSGAFFMAKSTKAIPKTDKARAELDVAILAAILGWQRPPSRRTRPASIRVLKSDN